MSKTITKEKSTQPKPSAETRKFFMPTLGMTVEAKDSVAAAEATVALSTKDKAKDEEVGDASI